MHRFLASCASYIYEHYKPDIHNICLVFPNRRSGVFFTAYLQQLSNKPLIGPQITTIDRFAESFSDLHVADRLMLVSLLYKTFQKETGYVQTFDDFYFWGEVLLSDFDDIDKYMVNARHLFANIEDIKKIEGYFDYLTAQQKEVLERFWGTLGNWNDHDMQRDFVTLWGKLYGVYSEFRGVLQEQKTGYRGMVLRNAVEKMDSGSVNLTNEKYIFIGLNTLNTCEIAILNAIKNQRKAQFLWDYDVYYLNNPMNDAGKFMRENLRDFPPPDDFDPGFDAFSKPKKIEIIPVPSSYGQSQVIPRFFDDFAGNQEDAGLGSNAAIQGDNFDTTAVVLADESLLFPALGALPASIKNINVTMGYPVKNSPVAGFVQLLSAMLRGTPVSKHSEPRIYFRLVTDILQHQLLANAEPVKVHEILNGIVSRNRVYIPSGELCISPLHTLIFSLPNSTLDYSSWFLRILEALFQQTLDHDGIASELESQTGISTDRAIAENGNPVVKEMIYAIYLAFEKLQSSVQEVSGTDGVVMSPAIYLRLMNQYLSGVTVPFEGEPLSGLQVMGVLETRCLDFENIIIAGLNEDMWPRPANAPSMIPYHLRKSFGLPGIDDQNAMVAYYFYRLIQRAKRVTATWNTIREGVAGGELSRFGFQLKLLSPHKVETPALNFPFISSSITPISVNSSSAVTELLLQRNADTPLSPSAINIWLGCSLRFWFRYVLRIEEPDEVLEEIDRRVFGNIFHKAVEDLYAPYTGTLLDKQAIEKIKKDRKKIEAVVRNAFASEYYKQAPGAGEVEISGKAYLIYSTILSYIRNMLDLDLQNAPFLIHSLENSYHTSVQVPVNGKMQTVRVGGKIDRLDEVDGVLRVIDYKTGSLQSADLGCYSLSELVAPEAKKIKKEIVQGLVYGYVLHKSYYPKHRVAAIVYAVLQLNNEQFNPNIRVGKSQMEVETIAGEWEGHLKDILAQIYSSDAQFSQTIFKEPCKYCPYKLICGR